VKAWIAHVRAEVSMTLRRGESLLLTVGIPAGLLTFFTLVNVTPVPRGVSRVNFLTPGVLALAIVSTSLVSLSIATGFERSYGVLRRLWVTPFSRRALVTSKAAAVVLVEVIQVSLLALLGLALGWRPRGGLLAGFEVAGVAVLASVACAGIGLFLAGTLRAEINLAATNGLYLVLLLGSGLVLPLHSLPSAARGVAIATPAGALGDALHRVVGSGTPPTVADLVSLVAWAVGAPLLAARAFRLD